MDDATPLQPEALRSDYSAFLQPSSFGGAGASRVLLTGHSHQAWPDVAEAGLRRAFADAAEHVDDKWSRAEEAAQAVRQAVVAELSGRADDVALAANSHELVTRFLSALDWQRRRRIVTTDGEFHSLARQLDRLEEEGIAVVRVPTEPLDTLSERLAASLTDDTAAVMLSTVLFRTSAVVPHLEAVVVGAERVGAEVLFDAYHHFRVVPPGALSSLTERAFISGGGYKYAQWGEGCCFLRIPPGSVLRPVYTGWFAAFGALAERAEPGRVVYGARQADRFAGSTYDPCSHYRARAVCTFFHARNLSIQRLRECSLGQTSRIMRQLEALPTFGDAFEIATPREAANRGGFVAVRVLPSAARTAVDAAAALRQRRVYVDARDDILRFGPAPYTLDAEIEAGVAAFGEVLGSPA